MQVVTRATTNTGVELSVTGGAVTMEGRRAIARDASLTIAPTATMSVYDLYDMLLNPAIEVLIARGLNVGGIPEYVPLGVFSTDRCTVTMGAGGSVQWQGSDRAKKIRRARLTDPYRIASGTSLAAAGAAFLLDRFPALGTDADFSNVTATIGTNVIFEHGPDSDPWRDAQGLFSARGYDLHFDGAGIARATVITDPVDAVFSFGSGETSRVLGGDMGGTLDAVYNGVIATGEGTDVAEPVRAELWDTDEASPTYYLGAMGKVPYFYTSSLLTTVALCTQAAQTILARVKGGAQTLSWSAVVNPALEPYDCVEVDVDGSTTRYVLDRITVPLRAADALSAVAREVALTW